METFFNLGHTGFVDILGFFLFRTSRWRCIILMHSLNVQSYGHGKATRPKIRGVDSERFRAPCLEARHVIQVQVQVGRHFDEAGCERASGDRLVSLPKAYEE